MSTADTPAGGAKYYDPTEVEAYVNDATKTIKALQARLEEAARRADEAERSLGDYHPETASLGRALLLAGEVADKTIADADTRAEEIVRAAEKRAQEIVDAAQAEADRLIGGAEAAAANVFQEGEARLLAAVGAFVEGSNVLRAELAKIEEDASNWRGSIRSPGPLQPLSSPLIPPSLTSTPPAAHDSSRQEQFAGGIHNWASRDAPPRPVPPNDPADSHDGAHSALKITPFAPLPPFARPEDRSAGNGT